MMQHMVGYSRKKTILGMEGAGVIMINYDVKIDKENHRFVIDGPIRDNSIPIEIPKDNPFRERFIDLFLHKADIERGVDFLQCISNDKSITVNEGLFIAGLNNCMKCFKYSNARNKLVKQQVFAQSEEMLKRFLEFEQMRDKHYDHDENGMLQAVAFLLISKDEGHVFSGPPSVVWNRAQLNYYLAGQKLQEIMCYILQYIEKEIDIVGNQIAENYKYYFKGELLKWSNAQIILASDTAKRK